MNSLLLHIVEQMASMKEMVFKTSLLTTRSKQLAVIQNVFTV